LKKLEDERRIAFKEGGPSGKNIERIRRSISREKGVWMESKSGNESVLAAKASVTTKSR